MLTKEQNQLLTRVGPGTPMGDLMRRYWVPAIMSWEIDEPDSPPVTIKVLGEELVAFRDTNGKVGIVGARCAHRRAHLFWGRNEECGLRCVYHGWKFDVNGQCVDMPSEPVETNFKDKVRIPAYPTFEIAGLVFCYMGPKDKQPAPPLFQWTQAPPERRAMSKVWQGCNWLQALEGGIDNVHSTFLHGGRPPGYKYDSSTPRGRGRNISKALHIEVVPTDYGYCYGSLLDLGEEGTNWVRGYHWIMPWNQIRAEGGGDSGHFWVPMDDENTMVYNWAIAYDDQPSTDPRRGARDKPVELGPDTPPWFKYARRPIGTGNDFALDVDVEHDFRSIRNRDNLFMIDRELQRTQTFTGITGLNTQDRAVQESMGPVADRTLERLGTTDRAIVHARGALLKAIKTVQDGGDPPGLAPTYYPLRSHEMAVPKGDNWYEAIANALKVEDTPAGEVLAEAFRARAD
ncbi:MAG TPA: Rieske 2Fe-2S domain-containing protein [Chloroflexota bacterium]|jgi:phenylpropionate dioxygenase-like ring-hydroxylating dioxygenase large terminal subunit